MTSSTVLIVEDDVELRQALLESLQSDTQSVLAAADGRSAIDVLKTHKVGLVVSDLQMQPMDGLSLLAEIRAQHPSLPTVMMTAHGTIDNAVAAMRLGAKDYLVKPFTAQELQTAVSKYLPPDCDDAPIAVDPATLELMEVARRVANTDVTVTISGPSGCGKEVIARHVHGQSKRRSKPFVAINCAAIPETMLEAVLFGYEKGAFTGAMTTHPGKFEQASGGTLLLDEVSEMDLGLQAKLLRVIQEKEVERLGGREIIPLDVRVLATTNRDLKKFVSDGKFREDLYYRLNVFPLHIPALRERPGDILPLARRIVARHGSCEIEIAECAEQVLCAHDWPGNVRELENVLQRSMILLGGKQIRATDLCFEAMAQQESRGELCDGLRDREYQLIADAMQKHKGKRANVAATLGISPRSLRYKLARMREQGYAIPGELS